MSRREEHGAALVMVLLMVAILFVLAMGLLMQSGTERVVSANEQDHLRALGAAEAGLVWVQQRIADAGGSNGLTDLLLGPDDDDSADDHLPGLRDLSLSDTSQLDGTNEATASAVVERDFTGDGPRRYEAIRLEEGPGVRALVYVRIDDNYDDDLSDPANDDPLRDTDERLRATVVAEYPVFVDAGGVALAPGGPRRSPARSILTASFGGARGAPAILSQGDLEIVGSLDVCGACGSVHANADVEISQSPQVCRDATASGAWSQSGSPTFGGVSGGGFATIEVPVINPYDTEFVPSIEVFDTTGLALPAELRCGPPTPADPGNAKYFAFVADDDQGKIFKAYWDFTDERWTWKMVDDLSDETDDSLDSCGRAPGDPFYGTAIDDERSDEFYGWELKKKESVEACPSCSSSGADATLCDLGANDFGLNGYYHTDTGLPVTFVAGSGIPALPGSFDPDGQPDFDPATRHRDSLWRTKTATVYAPLFNAVLFFYGNVKVGHHVGRPGTTYCGAGGCGSMPAAMWMAALISYGDLDLGHSSYHGRPNPDVDYPVLLVAGRDVKISGHVSESTEACGAGCSSAAPADVAALGGITAAHEQVEITGAQASLHGRILIEDAAGCSDLVSGRQSKVKDFALFYDCEHPPSGSVGSISRTSWQELN